MKKYEIEIDGQVYHVKVRELPDDAVMTSNIRRTAAETLLMLHPKRKEKQCWRR